MHYSIGKITLNYLEVTYIFSTSVDNVSVIITHEQTFTLREYTGIKQAKRILRSFLTNLL